MFAGSRKFYWLSLVAVVIAAVFAVGPISSAVTARAVISPHYVEPSGCNARQVAISEANQVVRSTSNGNIMMYINPYWMPRCDQARYTIRNASGTTITNFFFQIKNERTGAVSQARAVTSLVANESRDIIIDSGIDDRITGWVKFNDFGNRSVITTYISFWTRD